MPETHQNPQSSECGRPGDSCPEEELDLETLESDLKQKAQKVLEYRTTLPDQLKTTLHSVLAAQRPLLPQVSGAPNYGASEQNISRGESSLQLEDPEVEKKLKLLNEKIAGNCSAMPVVLKRVNDCIAKIEKLDTSNTIIHSAFKRKKTR